MRLCLLFLLQTILSDCSSLAMSSKVGETPGRGRTLLFLLHTFYLPECITVSRNRRQKVQRNMDLLHTTDENNSGMRDR